MTTLIPAGAPDGGAARRAHAGPPLTGAAVGRRLDAHRPPTPPLPPTRRPRRPQLGEIVVIGRTPTCVTRLVAEVEGTWWVQTALAPCTALIAGWATTGRTWVWVGEAFALG